MRSLHEFEIDETGKRALLVWNVAGRAELALLDLATGTSRPITGTPFDVVGSALPFAGRSPLGPRRLGLGSPHPTSGSSMARPAVSGS